MEENLTKNNSKLYLPINIQNLAYYLSSGFLGSSDNENMKKDIQNNFGFKNILFDEFPVPKWALNFGEEGDKCVIKIRSDDLLIKNGRQFKYCDDLIPIYNIECIYFVNEESLKNFQATFRHFKEIPINIFEFKTHELGNDDDVIIKNEISKLDQIKLYDEREKKDVLLSITSMILDNFEIDEINK